MCNGSAVYGNNTVSNGNSGIVQIDSFTLLELYPTPSRLLKSRTEGRQGYAMRENYFDSRGGV